MEDFLNIMIESIKNFKGIILLFISYFVYIKLFVNREIIYARLDEISSYIIRREKYRNESLKKLLFNTYMHTLLLLLVLLVYSSFFIDSIIDSNIYSISLMLLILPIITFVIQLFFKEFCEKVMLYIQAIFIFMAIDSHYLFINSYDRDFTPLIVILVLGIIVQLLIKKFYIETISTQMKFDFYEIRYLKYSWDLKIQLICILILMTTMVYNLI